MDDPRYPPPERSWNLLRAAGWRVSLEPMPRRWRAAGSHPASGRTSLAAGLTKAEALYKLCVTAGLDTTPLRL